MTLCHRSTCVALQPTRAPAPALRHNDCLEMLRPVCCMPSSPFPVQLYVGEVGGTERASRSFFDKSVRGVDQDWSMESDEGRGPLRPGVRRMFECTGRIALSLRMNITR